ncbi:MAG: hypothetical protein ACOCQD_01695 [archaeon]
MEGNTMCQKKPVMQRNPYVQHVKFKKSGPHQKSKKSIRQQEKIKLKKQGKDYFIKNI